MRHVFNRKSALWSIKFSHRKRIWRDDHHVFSDALVDNENHGAPGQ